MSYSIATLLTRNLHDVFGKNDPASYWPLACLASRAMTTQTAEKLTTDLEQPLGRMVAFESIALPGRDPDLLPYLQHESRPDKERRAVHCLAVRIHFQRWASKNS
jgi:hypothetical protein